MARFLMWMVHFFSMAIFWRYMNFVWFIRKDKDFLQVQMKYCNELYNVVQSLEESFRAMKASSWKKVLNKNQCTHLFGKLIFAMKGIEKMLSNTTKDLNFQSIFEELCYLQKKIEIVRFECTEQEQWCHMAIHQLQNKETFREFLSDIKCYYNTIRDMYLFHHPNQSENVLHIQFDAATYEQVLEDGQKLKKRLELVPQGEDSEDYEIAQHLLLRLRNLDRVDGGDLDALEVPNDFKTPQLFQELGSYGDVYKSNWLGLVCATKVLKVGHGNLRNSQKEAGILAGLSHPNLVQFFGCGIIQKLDENPKEDEIGEMHLVMELMDSNLSTILKKAKRPLSYSVAVDIMLQIANGVYYLHDMQIAHLDLKPDNVLYNSISMEGLDPCHIFKITDYGSSQLEVYSKPEKSEPSDSIIGTRGYMAPEMIKGSKTPRYPFKADVWSFAMVCSEILTGKVPYSSLKPKEFYERITSTHGLGLRPTLPNDCIGLTVLIQECWSQDPLQRPTFSNICKRLTNLKKFFLKRGLCASRDFENHVLRVDDPIAPPKEVQVDLDHQLCKAKGLLKKKYIGIVGMGGIGKTTLAKAIFDDVTVKSSYHASDFVAQCKDYQSSYDILCKILSKLGNEKKPKNLEDAQDMIKALFLEKKVLLILDDIMDDSQVHDIVPPDILKSSKGSSIIITTRNWSTIKSFVGNEGRLDVGLLDEKAATILFTTHLSWGLAPLSPGFEDLCEHVVTACNGLPLSLKVMGSFLHNKERLRSWERALQRMARGRNLDGDEEIWNTLQISFDGLNNGVEKGMFLDVACFFCRDVYPSGISKEMILSMWSKDGILPVDELQRLIDMSLLKVNEDGDILEMHDQLRDMGRKISKGTRVWKASMIPETGFSSEDVKVLQGISLQGNMNHHLSKIKEDQCLDFKNLRVLILVSPLDNFQAHIDNLDLLLWLASQCSKLEAIIVGSPLFSKSSTNWIGLPHILQTNIAITLRSKISNLCVTCPSLKILDLVGLVFLEQLPREIAMNGTLLRLNLSHCSSLATLPMEVGNLSFLTTFNLSNCSSLVALPKEVENLSSLTTLYLDGCSSLVTLPKEVGNLSSLTNLDLQRCSSLVALPKEVGNLSFLTIFNLSDCSSLAALPKEVENLSSLTTLYLDGCSSLVTLPKEVENLSSLTTLKLSGCLNLVALPKEVGSLSSLNTLFLDKCSSLVTLPQELGNLSSLTTFSLNGCSSLVAFLDKALNFSFLTTLDLSHCSSLVALPKEVGNLFSLTTFNLISCSKLATLPKEVGNLSSLTTFNLSHCSSLVALPKEVGKLSFLTTLNLNFCSSLLTLPKEVGNLSFLTTLALTRFLSLEALPIEVGNLSSLTTLQLSLCGSMTTLVEEVGNLSFLTTLYLDGCSSLVILPKEVGNLSSLTTLYLDGCSSLITLPKEVGNLSSLTTLFMDECSSLVTLPKEMGNLFSLTTLSLNDCTGLVSLPKEIGNLASLIILYLNDCSNLVALPKEVGSLSSLKSLNLENCASLAALPKEVTETLASLTFLDLSFYPSLVTVPKEVWNFSSLAILKLTWWSSLKALPKEVENLSFLTTLDLNKCSSLVALPKEVGNLSYLTTLDLGRCSSLVALPKEVGNLFSLTTLNLEECSSLVALPKEVGNLSSLTILNLNFCSSLVSLPKEMGNMSCLTTLYLDCCTSLKALPKEVQNLSSLITLNLSGCSNLAALSKEVEN